MKKINYLGFTGLIGLLGILGLVSENKGFIGYFGAFSFFMFFKVEPDELFVKILMKSASIGFFTGLAVSSILTPIQVLIYDALFPDWAYIAGSWVSFLAFLTSFVYFNYQENQGTKNDN